LCFCRKIVKTAKNGMTKGGGKKQQEGGKGYWSTGK